MSASLKNAVQKREYKERAQPRSRINKHGLLEKHKDYVKRARDFHRKEDTLRALREKARLRNTDEFYHGMMNARTHQGVHYTTHQQRLQRLDAVTLKLMKSQDVNYIKTQLDRTRKQIDRLQSELAFIGVVGGSSEIIHHDDIKHTKRHTVFVDDVEQVATFDAATYLDTPEAFLDRTFNRPRTQQLLQPLQTVAVKQTEDTTTKEVGDASEKYMLLKQLMARAKALEKVEKELVLKAHLSNSKGQRRVVGQDANGNPIYKWRAERTR